MGHYHTQGQEPQIIGQRCTGLVLQQIYEDGRITDQVNVAYLRFAEQWYRLYFECSTIFWSTSGPPEAAENSDLAHGLLLNDLSGMESVIGQRVREVAYSASESGDVRAVIRLFNGKRLEFEYNGAGDCTRLCVG